MELLNHSQNRKPFDAISATNSMRDHLMNFLSSRIERDAESYVAYDVLVISPTQAFEGREAYLTVNRQLREQIPDARFTLIKARYSNDRVSYVWDACSPTAKVSEGYCMSIFNNGKVVQFTIDYKVVPLIK